MWVLAVGVSNGCNRVAPEAAEEEQEAAVEAEAGETGVLVPDLCWHGSGFRHVWGIARCNQEQQEEAAAEAEAGEVLQGV